MSYLHHVAVIWLRACSDFIQTGKQRHHLLKRATCWLRPAQVAGSTSGARGAYLQETEKEHWYKTREMRWVHRTWTDRGLVHIVHTLFDKFYFVNSMYILTTDILLRTDPDKRQTRPLVREGAPHDMTVTFLLQEISGGLDTKPD
jgi:hypothetical protein